MQSQEEKRSDLQLPSVCAEATRIQMGVLVEESSVEFSENWPGRTRGVEVKNKKLSLSVSILFAYVFIEKKRFLFFAEFSTDRVRGTEFLYSGANGAEF